MPRFALRHALVAAIAAALALAAPAGASEQNPRGRLLGAVAPSGAGRDARVHAQIDATLRQFPTIRAVRLIGSTGRCLFDLSGQDRCSGPPVQPRPGG